MQMGADDATDRHWAAQPPLISQADGLHNPPSWLRDPNKEMLAGCAEDSRLVETAVQGTRQVSKRC